ncbi:MAG: hypothetical protein N2643_02380 [Endomicrobia bacterium]|nr:hypothetical protein [Endomicrobiia bacterium]
MRTTVVTGKTKKATKQSKYEITIDYPKNLEVITHKQHYAIRIGTPNIGIVEVSIDKGSFNRCRFAAGYWWYDWNNISEGTHTIIARLIDPVKEKTLKKSETIKCIVK